MAQNNTDPNLKASRAILRLGLWSKGKAPRQNKAIVKTVLPLPQQAEKNANGKGM